MADRKRGKRKREDEGLEKPTKEEYSIAKHLRFNVPTREGKLVGMTVQCFTASKAIDALLESKWAKAKEPLFTTRSACADYCYRLLEKGIFHRAAKVEKKKEKKPKKKEKEEKDTEEVGKEEKVRRRKKKDKESKEEDKEQEKESEGEKEKDAEKEKKDDEKRKKKEKKLKLEMHQEQVFKDGDEVYVWIYDPVPVKTFIIGLLLVLGAIAVCLFPLWPPEVRIGVYYLSLAAACFVGFILVLCVVRFILFSMIWVGTAGRHHFWFLPNLTEDVGFFESFMPLYKHDLKEWDTTGKEKDKSEEKKEEGEETADKAEDKKGEEEEGKEQVEETAVKTEDKKGEDEEAKEDETGEVIKGEGEEREETVEEKDEVVGEEEGKGDGVGGSRTGSEGSNDNGYELVDPEDLEEGEEVEGNEEPKKTK